MKKWYSIAKSRRSICGNCNSVFYEIENHDHHNSICPNCGITCIWYSLKDDYTLQIIPEYCPDVLLSFIKWGQSELDELEFLELITLFEEIGEFKSKVK